MITCLCVKKFLNAEMPPTDDDIARELEIPIRLVRLLLSQLTESRLLSEVRLDHQNHIAYQPACDIDRLTITAIMERLDQRGIDTITIGESTILNRLGESLRQFQEMNEQSSVNLKLRELCIGAQPKQIIT